MALSRLNDTHSSSLVFAITPNDSTDLSYITRGLYVGGAGDIVLRAEDNSSNVTLVAVPAGSVLPIRVKRVLSTGTSATNLVGLV